MSECERQQLVGGRDQFAFRKTANANNLASVSFPAAEPHAPLEKVLDDVYFLHGSIRMAPGMRINRNMVVFRHDGELTLVNPVRLDDDAELDKLGAVKHVVRIGAFHGMDDRYYLDKYDAKFWSQERAKLPDDAPKPDVVIAEHGEVPIPNATFFVFREAKEPESALLLNRHGGVLVTCDSVQHHVDKTNCSFLGKAAMSLMGFMRPMNIGPPWLKRMTKEGGSLEPDFRRLLELDFDHAAGGHGQFCKGGAHDKLSATVTAVFN